MRPNIFPALRYRDGHAAIDWLVRVFGFEATAVFHPPVGGVGHAELRLARRHRTQLGGSTPSESVVSVGQGIYVCVQDVDAHHDRAKPPAPDRHALTDQSYGSREYAVRDPAGHLWGYGTYDMQAPQGDPNIFIGLHYSDAPAALAFLERAFGFRKTFEVKGPDGQIAHAEMRFGDGAVFIDSESARTAADWGDKIRKRSMCACRIRTRITLERRRPAQPSSSRRSTRRGRAVTTRATSTVSSGASATTRQPPEDDYSQVR
jgi:uncharacterized glyoxalase superfamily protein PhnB